MVLKNGSRFPVCTLEFAHDFACTQLNRSRPSQPHSYHLPLKLTFLGHPELLKRDKLCLEMPLTKDLVGHHQTHFDISHVYLTIVDSARCVGCLMCAKSVKLEKIGDRR